MADAGVAWVTAPSVPWVGPATIAKVSGSPSRSVPRSVRTIGVLCAVVIALETPWKQLAGDGGYIASDWVKREFSYAETLGKELIAVVHQKVGINSAFGGREHAARASAVGLFFS